MSYFSDILKRASLRGIREYLLNGSEQMDMNCQSCNDWIKESFRKYIEIAEAHGFDEDSELQAAVNNLLSAHECAYMEVGIQAGFRLAKDILGNGETNE